MDSVLSVNFGLVFWTLVNFLIFLFLLIKFGTKPISNALKNREKTIADSIKNAENANSEAKRILEESQKKLGQSQAEMNEIINRGKLQAEKIIQKAADDGESVKRIKIEEALREIERTKELAIKELRTEVATLVISAAEKILDEKLDNEKDKRLVENAINNIDKVSHN